MKKYYFLGIGGVSMSALAIKLKQRGDFVSGSDERKSRATEILQQNKIEVDFSINKKRILEADIVVASSAIKNDNEQLLFAKQKHKKIWTRGQMLGLISSGYEKVIAVAGSHGKTTTTAMIYQILSVAGLNPTLHLGGFRLEDKLNFHFGGKEFFVTEACEYCDNFLNLHSEICVVTNIEKEHMDYFKTFSNQLKSFEKFKSQSKIVVDDVSDFVAKNIKHDEKGNLKFNLFKNNQKIMSLHLQICEEINTQNCIFAYKVAKLLNIPDCQIKLGLESFKGVQTRFEKMNCLYFDVVICDYAHHPTEISKAIKTAKRLFKNKTILTIFQPHTYSRTKSLLNEFLEVFEKEEYPLFYKTYSAREKPSDGLSAEKFCEILKKRNKNAKYFENFDDLNAFFKKFDKNQTILLFLGAGDLPTILHKNKFIS